MARTTGALVLTDADGYTYVLPPELLGRARVDPREARGLLRLAAVRGRAQPSFEIVGEIDLSDTAGYVALTAAALSA